jgi:hypothetical protein
MKYAHEVRSHILQRPRTAHALLFYNRMVHARMHAPCMHHACTTMPRSQRTQASALFHPSRIHCTCIEQTSDTHRAYVAGAVHRIRIPHVVVLRMHAQYTHMWHTRFTRTSHARSTRIARSAQCVRCACVLRTRWLGGAMCEPISPACGEHGM